MRSSWRLGGQIFGPRRVLIITDRMLANSTGANGIVVAFVAHDADDCRVQITT